MKQKRLYHNSSLCDGCGLCQLTCTLAHCGQWNHYQSRIKIVDDMERKARYAVFCAQCEDAPCILSCLMNTIYKQAGSDITVRDLDQCIGCRACELACPFDAAIFDVIQEKVVNCDLCAGRPVCVEYCPNQALTYDYPGDQTEKYRHQAAAQKFGSPLLEVLKLSGKEG